MNKEYKDVHTEHCCILHGCKYGNDAFCTVVTKQAPQSYCCEACGDDGIRDLKMLTAVMEGRQKRCPYCEHTLP